MELFPKKALRKALRNAYKLEPLEQRILLSADPVFGAAQAMLPADHQLEVSLEQIDRIAREQALLEQRARERAVQQIADRNTPADVTFDLSGGVQDFAELGFIQGDIFVGGDATLKGSGQFDGALYNDALVAPGYSPGEINTTTYNQSADGTLQIEIAGTGDSQFDRIVASERAILDGDLEVVLLDGFQPEVGDQFRFIETPQVEGNFDNATGLIGFRGDLYFEIQQDSEGVLLTVKELIDGVDVGFAFDQLSDFTGLNAGQIAANTSQLNNVGRVLNYDYFGATGSASFSTDLDLQLLSVSGDFTISRDTSVTLNTGAGAQSYSLITIAAQNASASAGLDGVLSLGLADTDLDLGIVSRGDDQWVYTDMTAGP